MGKTKQASVRFDPEKLELVKRREKLQTPQKVVDFLMDSYYWQNKLIVAPQLQTLGQTLPYVAPVVPKSPFEQYEKELKEAGSIDELQTIGVRIERDKKLTPKEVESLHEIGQSRVDKVQ